MLNIIAGLAVLGGVAYLIVKMMNAKEPAPIDTDKPKTEPVAAPAAEAPKPAACGCGRSTTGFCVGLHKLSEEEWAVHQDNPKISAAPAAGEPKVEAAAEEPAAKPKRVRKPKDPAAPKKPRKKKGE